MRIVGGELGGRRFKGPPSDLTRPTSDRVREAVASALQSRGAFDDVVVLDLFAGTGALSFEALSRGASQAVLVERDARVLKVLQQSSCELGLRKRCRLVKRDLLRSKDNPDARAELAERIGSFAPTYGLVFADPPYAEIDAVPPLLDALSEAGALAPDALVVVEHEHGRPPGPCQHFATEATYRYGGTGVVMLRHTVA